MDRRPRPNLFLIGAMKSGTTTLHQHLAAHPSVFMSDPKEPCYFVARSQLDWPAIEARGFWRGEKYYLELFEAAGDLPVVGESSTLYSKAPRISGVPERIARFNPAARIVYIMRDPIERAISHYWHQVRFQREHRDLLTAVREEPHYREVSHYAMQLEPYRRLFGAERVATLTIEGLRADPLGEIERLYRWLGIDPSFVPDDIGARRHATPERIVRPKGSGRLERFRYSPLWNALGPAVPAPIRAFGRRLAAESLDRASETEAQRRVAEFLRPFQRAETEALAEMLGRPFPEWTVLYGD